MPERFLMNEIEAHQSRVGKKPEARLQWAIDFAVKDLAPLTVGDRENLRRDLAAFAFTPQVHDVEAYTRSVFVRGEVARLGQHNWERAYGVLPSWEQVEDAQAEFRRVLKDFLSLGQVKLGPFEITYHVTRHDIPIKTNPRRSSFFELVHKEKAAPGLLPFARLLGAFGAKVETCPEPTCRRIYVVKRVNQHFCSTHCQSRTTTRTYRNRKREEAEERATRRPGRPKGKVQKARTAGANRDKEK